MAKDNRRNPPDAPATTIAPGDLTRRHPGPYVILAILLGLCLLTAAVFGQVIAHDFINYDDHDYIFENPPVMAGLTASGIRWAWTTFHAANYHPLTWMSLMTDVSLFGVRPGPLVLMNAVFHTISVLLLFLALRRLTGSTWRSALVSALFAIHPLRAESVAWATERKDVLSTMFAFASLLCYVHYSRTKSKRSYLFSVFAMALGLLAKPMLVSLPALFMLLDWWPLRRMKFSPAVTKNEADNSPPALTAEPFSRLMREKVPLIILAVASGVVTLIAQKKGGAIQTLETVDFPLRLFNAVLSYIRYVGKITWPTHLAIPYPFDYQPSVAAAIGALTAVVLITLVVFLERSRRPYLLAGWLWFVVSLVPVIGIIQVGPQAMADRYTYLPSVGIILALVWLGYEILPNRGLRIGMAVAAILIYSALGFRQVSHWKNSISLFSHSIDVSAGNSLAHFSLGHALNRAGRRDDGIAQVREAIRIDQEISRVRSAGKSKTIHSGWYPDERLELGSALLDTARTKESKERELLIDEAIRNLRESVALKPTSKAENNLASALAMRGNTGEAATQYASALAKDPDSYDAHMNLGAVLSREGKTQEAIEHFRAAAGLQPSSVEPPVYLALALLQIDRIQDAIVEFRKVLAKDPRAANDFFTNATRLPPKETNLKEYIAFLEAESAKK